MNLDVRTMYMAMAVTCFIVAMALFISHAGRFRRDGTPSWTVGWVFQSAFWTLIGLRGAIWDFVSIVIASTFLTASFSFLYAAVREFQGRAYNRGTLLLPPLATFVFFWYFSVYVDNISYRIIFISLLSILQIIAIVWALFRDTPIQQRRSYQLAGFSFLVMAVVWFHRLLEGFTLPYGHLSILEATTFRNASVLVGLGTVILSSIGFVLMEHERAEQTLREGEEQLRQSEEKSRLLIKYAPSMLYEIDFHRPAFKSVNDAMCELLGYTREELLSMNPFDLLDDEGKALFRERIRRKLAGETISDSVEYKSKTKDGREVYGVLNMTFTYKDGNPEGAVVVAHDITERKRAEEALRRAYGELEMRVQERTAELSEMNKALEETRKYVESIVETIRESLLVLSPDLRVTSANRTFYETFKVTPEETLGQYLYDLGNRQWDIPRLRQLLEDILPKNTKFENFEVDHEFPTIGRRTMLLNARRIYQEGKGTQIILLAIEEITKRKQAEEALRKAHDQVRFFASQCLTAQERERRLIAGEIHDSLGASLATTKFKMEAAVNEMGDGNAQTKAALESVIPIIEETIKEARRIQMALRPSMLDDLGILATINWFCRQFESTYTHIHIGQEINIEESEVPDSLRTVIFRLLQEAMNNIAKHSKGDRVNLLLRKMDGGIELRVQDNGQGFDPEEAISRVGTAKGLGLDSMRERAQLSGGSFSIESSKGAGTVIRATWPLNS